MPIVNCQSCAGIVAIPPYTTESVKCGACGSAVLPLPIPRELELTSVERTEMEGWERFHADLRGGTTLTPELFPDRAERLLNAVRSGATWRVKRELVDGADPNQFKSMQSSPLHVAAELGYTEIVKILLARGANAGRLNPDGHTPIEVAAARGNQEVAALLEAHLACSLSFVRAIYPFTYALAGLCLPVPAAWILLILGPFSGFFIGPFLGFVALGHGCLWLFLRDRKRFEARSRFVAGTLCYGGFTWTAIGLALSLLFLVMAPWAPLQSTGELLFGCAIIVVPSAILGGVGLIQYRATPGTLEDDPRD